MNAQSLIGALLLCLQKPSRPAAVPSWSSPLKRQIMQACAQVSAQADVTPLQQQHSAALRSLGIEAPGSGPGTGFGSPQLGNVMSQPQHWPSAHAVHRIAQCRT